MQCSFQSGNLTTKVKVIEPIDLEPIGPMKFKHVVIHIWDMSTHAHIYIYICVELGCPIEVSWPIFRTPLWTRVSNSLFIKLSITSNCGRQLGKLPCDGQSFGLTYVGSIIHSCFPLPSSWLKLMFCIPKSCFPGVSDTPVCRCISYTCHVQNYVPEHPYRTF